MKKLKKEDKKLKKELAEKSKDLAAREMELADLKAACAAVGGGKGLWARKLKHTTLDWLPPSDQRPWTEGSTNVIALPLPLLPTSPPASVPEGPRGRAGRAQAQEARRQAREGGRTC